MSSSDQKDNDAALYQAAQDARSLTRQIAQAHQEIDRLAQEIKLMEGAQDAAVGRALKLLGLDLGNWEKLKDDTFKVHDKILSRKQFYQQAAKCRFVRGVIDQADDLGQPPFDDDPALLEKLKPLMTQKYQLTATVSQMGVEWSDPALVAQLTSNQK